MHSHLILIGVSLRDIPQHIYLGVSIFGHLHSHLILIGISLRDIPQHIHLGISLIQLVLRDVPQHLHLGVSFLMRPTRKWLNMEQTFQCKLGQSLVWQFMEQYFAAKHPVQCFSSPVVELEFKELKSRTRNIFTQQRGTV